jgi:hypothetical protein
MKGYILSETGKNLKTIAEVSTFGGEGRGDISSVRDKRNMPIQVMTQTTGK